MRRFTSFNLRGLLFILSLIGIGLLLKETGFAHLFQRESIDSQVRGHGIAGVGLYLLAGSLTTAVGLPRQLVAFFGGYAFGLAAGVAWSSLATLMGCFLAFYYARWFGRDLVKRWFPDRLRRFDGFVRQQPFLMTLLLRLLPVGSNLATNLVAGISSIPSFAFFLASLIGYLPQTLVFALAGSGVGIDSRWQIVLSLVLFIVISFLGVALYRRLRNGHPLAPEMERGAEQE